MNVKTALAAAVGAAAAAGIAAVALAAPAQAGPNGTCASGYLCVYDGLNYNAGQSDANDRNISWQFGWAGEILDLPGNERWRDGDGDITSSFVNNDITSFKNRTGCTVVFYRQTNGGGIMQKFASGTEQKNLSDNRIGNNTISSFELLESDRC